MCGDLRAKTEVAPPARQRREQMRQPAMLKIRKPGDRRQRQAPSEKTGRFEHDVDTRNLKRLGRLTIEPERKRVDQFRIPPIEGDRSHDFDGGNARKRIEFISGLVGRGKENRRDFARTIAIERRKQIALIIIAACPKAPRNVRKRDAKRSLIIHAPAP